MQYGHDLPLGIWWLFSEQTTSSDRLLRRISHTTKIFFVRLLEANNLGLDKNLKRFYYLFFTTDKIFSPNFSLFVSASSSGLKSPFKILVSVHMQTKFVFFTKKSFTYTHFGIIYLKVSLAKNVFKKFQTYVVIDWWWVVSSKN